MQSDILANGGLKQMVKKKPMDKTVKNCHADLAVQVNTYCPMPAFSQPGTTVM